METRNLCLSCGACCAAYRVTFPYSEVDIHEGGCVPHQLTIRTGALRGIMRGTDGLKKRCAALQGKVGWNVYCSIYDHRPSSCRNFSASWQDNVANPICDRARVSYGLQPFYSFW